MQLLCAACNGQNDFIGGGSASFFTTAGLQSASISSETEGNDSFDRAANLNLDVNEPVSLVGSIGGSGDVDVYDIGPVIAGDRIVVEVLGSGGLDAIAALFDDAENLFYLNDDRNYFARQLNPYIEFVSRRASDHCYVAVASSPGTQSHGDYILHAVVMDEGAEIEVRPQTVLLNFDGADSVEFGGRPAVMIPRFDAGDISERLSGMSDELIALILEMVREDYVGLDVSFMTSRDGIDPPADATVLHFGAYDRALLGIAENVDEFNERRVQEAIVFTDTFAVFNVLQPSMEQYAQSLANVASHEAGHLLGLVHTSDRYGVMDVTATLRQLTRNQAFSRSNLERSSFPIGFQDSVQSLAEAIGGDSVLAQAASLAQLDQAKARSFSEAFSASVRSDVDLPRSMFSVCMCNRCEAGKLKQAHCGE